MTFSDKPKRIAIFASGSGSNAERILKYFQNHPSIEVALIVTNNVKAGVIERAANYNVPCEVVNKDQAKDAEYMLDMLAAYRINFIALAGYLKLIPAALTQSFDKSIVNIHPALLPKYGGKGMYGHHVHDAVYAAGDSESGMTIHYVNHEYDEGKPIFQASCDITACKSAKEIAAAVLRLEHQYYPAIIEQVLLSK